MVTASISEVKGFGFLELMLSSYTRRAIAKEYSGDAEKKPPLLFAIWSMVIPLIVISATETHTDVLLQPALSIASILPNKW